MFEKNLKISYLLDFYGDVLDEHTGAVMKAYYDDDLSLAEIAAGVGISRQGVRHLIKKGEEQLSFLENRLGLAAREEELRSLGAKLKESLNLLLTQDNEKVTEISSDLLDTVKRITDKL